MYLFDNNIRTKIIQNNQVVEGKTSDPIQTTNPNEVLVKEYYGKNRLEYWYKDYLFAYGVQEVKNLNKSRDSKRRVFYINKVKRLN
jgi:hypothetical protein